MSEGITGFGEALFVFGMSCAFGFGLALFGYVIGTVIGNILALFDVD